MTRSELSEVVSQEQNVVYRQDLGHSNQLIE